MKHPSIFSLIKADHRTIDSYFSKLNKTSPQAARTRDKLYAKLRSEITVHSHAEEKAVYPCLKDNPLTESLGYESIEAHVIVKDLLDKLDATPINHEEWAARLKLLEKTIKDHVKSEETLHFPKMVSAFSKESLTAMAEDFQNAKKPFLQRLGDLMSGTESAAA